MLHSARQSPFELSHAGIDMIVATFAGGMVVVVFYPLTLCAAAVKGFLAILRLRPSPSGSRVTSEGRIPAQLYPRRRG
jgi:hypothetical protein